MARASQTPITRTRIVDAAMTIVRERGVAKLTLEEAAKAAGLSKGGVLYHFKSKDDLIGGMVERLVEQLDQEDLAHYEREPEGPYRWLRASLRTAFNPDGPACDAVGGALLSVIALNPDLMVAVNKQYDEWLKRTLSDSPDPMLATLVTMALDGHYFERMMGLSPCPDEQKKQLLQYILGLLEKGNGAAR